MFTSIFLDIDKNFHDAFNGLENYSNFKQQKENAKLVLSEYITNKDNNENILDAGMLIENAFPQVKYDIFLSHSHADQQIAMKIKDALESVGLSVFIDSLVWQNSYEILKEIDDDYSISDYSSRYSYEKRNVSTSNVFLMLNSALHQMIDNSELLIFLGTSNSLSLQDKINDEQYLMSPWIFSELSFSKIVRRQDPKRKHDITTLDSSIVNESLKHHYPLPELDRQMSSINFIEWIHEMQSKGTSSTSCLDKLYNKLNIRFNTSS